MSQHTPGPWTVVFDEDAGYDCMSAAYTIFAGPERLRIADIDVDDYVRDRSNYVASHARHSIADANARLIAAAPVMLEALEWFLRPEFVQASLKALIIKFEEKALAALAQARGEATT